MAQRRQVVDDHHVAPRRARSEVGGAVQDSGPTGRDRQHRLLPQVSRPVGEHLLRPHHAVAVGAQQRQAAAISSVTRSTPPISRRTAARASMTTGASRQVIRGRPICSCGTVQPLEAATRPASSSARAGGEGTPLSLIA